MLLNIKNLILGKNSASYKKMLNNKIVRFKQIYKFYFDLFLIKRTAFVLIEKTLLKIKKTVFSG